MICDTETNVDTQERDEYDATWWFEKATQEQINWRTPIAERPPSVRRQRRFNSTEEAIGIDRRMAWESQILDSTMGMSVAGFAATEGGFDGWHLRDQRTRPALCRDLAKPRPPTPARTTQAPRPVPRARRASNATANCRGHICF